DPFAIAADTGSANGVLLVVRGAQWIAFRPLVRGEVLADDVRASGFASLLRDVVQLASVRVPHRRAILAVECRELMLRSAVAVRYPNVVVPRAVVAAAIPRSRPADEGDGIAGRREVRFLPFEERELPDRAALDRNGEALQIRWEGRRA